MNCLPRNIGYAMLRTALRSGEIAGEPLSDSRPGEETCRLRFAIPNMGTSCEAIVTARFDTRDNAPCRLIDFVVDRESKAGLRDAESLRGVAPGDAFRGSVPFDWKGGVIVEESDLAAVLELKDSRASRSSLLKLNGNPYHAAALSDNRFVVALTPLGNAKMSEPFNARVEPPSPQRRYYSIVNELNSESNCSKLDNLRSDTLNAFKAFSNGSHRDRDALLPGFRSYVSPKGLHHVLMSGIACGHRTLEDFIGSMGLPEYAGSGGVTRYARRFLDQGVPLMRSDYAPVHSDHHVLPEDLPRIYQLLLKQHVVMSEFFRQSAVSVKGMRLAHGVLTEGPSDVPFSVGVDSRRYLRAFLGGHPILYRAPVSTTTELEVARTFMAESTPTRPELTQAVDLQDSSPHARIARDAMIEQVMANDSDAAQAGILMILDCDDAKGVLLEPETTGQRIDEMEVFIPPGHVMLPQAVLHGPGIYVLHARLAASAAVADTPLP